MNLATQRERARDLAGIRQTELAPDPRVTELLNESYLELAGAEDWPWLYIDLPTVAVTAGVADVDLPVEFRTFEGVLFDGYRLRNVALADMDVAAIEREDDPYAYARVGERGLLLAPTPKVSGTLRVRGYRTPPELAADEDEPLFDAEFHHILPYAAATKLLIEEGDDSGRAEAYTEQTREVADRMRSRYMASHEARTFAIGARHQVRRRWRL